jgi:pyridoxine 5-phosphate synthase
VQIALSIRPDTATLVPERREELTTEGGLDVITGGERIASAVKKLAQAGIRVSLFIDPDLDQVKESMRVGARAIEIHTGRYAATVSAEDRRAAVERVADAAALGHKIGLEVAAGHGLDTVNIAGIARIREITEVNIGHSIVARSVFVGIREAVREMIQAIRYHRASG